MSAYKKQAEVKAGDAPVFLPNTKTAPRQPGDGVKTINDWLASVYLKSVGNVSEATFPSPSLCPETAESEVTFNPIFNFCYISPKGFLKPIRLLIFKIIFSFAATFAMFT
ncbi:MAG: hypothetical protein AAF685_10000 [Cyanobacteria bacterium P01_C01_bin.89]